MCWSGNSQMLFWCLVKNKTKITLEWAHKPFLRTYITVTCHQQPRPLTCRRLMRVPRHEKLWNYVTWPAWENSNVFSLQLVLVQQRNFRLQITIARWIHIYILLHSYATFDSNAIPIPSLTPYNWVFTANLGTPNGAGNVILQQATCVCLIGWELNQNFYECLQRIFIPCATCLYYFPL